MRRFHAFPIVLLLAAFGALAQAPIRLAEVQAALEAGPPDTTVRGWAEQAYPGLLKSPALPDGLVLGFLVTPEYKVIRHSATMQRMGPINDDLELMFVPLSFKRGTESGAQCFPALADTPKFCVYWAVASEAPSGG